MLSPHGPVYEIPGSQQVAFARINAAANEGIWIEPTVQREVQTQTRRGAVTRWRNAEGGGQALALTSGLL